MDSTRKRTIGKNQKREKMNRDLFIKALKNAFLGKEMDLLENHWLLNLPKNPLKSDKKDQKQQIKFL